MQTAFDLLEPSSPQQKTPLSRWRYEWLTSWSLIGFYYHVDSVFLHVTKRKRRKKKPEEVGPKLAKSREFVEQLHSNSHLADQKYTAANWRRITSAIKDVQLKPEEIEDFVGWLNGWLSEPISISFLIMKLPKWTDIVRHHKGKEKELSNVFKDQQR